MIKHIVMWKLKEVAEGKTKAENATIMKELLEGLPAKIEEMDTAEVGISFLDGTSDAHADVVLTTTCASREALEAYAVHPEHQKVVQFILKVVEERRVVDYEGN